MVVKNNSQKEAELAAVNLLIAKEDEIQDELQTKLKASFNRKKSYLQTRLMIKGIEGDFSNKTIPELLEMLLQKYGAKHVNELKHLLESEFGREAGKQTISGTLIRYVNKDKIFKRAGRNIFDLKNRNTEESS